MTILNLRQGSGNKVNVPVHSFLRYCKKWKSCERETGDLKQKLLNGYQLLGYAYSVNGFEKRQGGSKYLFLALLLEPCISLTYA
jgi:hypothetical protein